MKKILGVIMCGGESKRMGSDKGLRPVHNSIWAKFMAEKLLFTNCPVVFSINKNQIKSYSQYISFNDLIIDDNELKGPARGLVTVHNSFPGRDILLIACDMLKLDEHTIMNLLRIYEHENFYDFYVYQDEEYAQPFCGIYTSNGMDKLHDHILSGALTNVSMQYVLNNGLTKRIVIEDKNAFANFNSKT